MKLLLPLSLSLAMFTVACSSDDKTGDDDTGSGANQLVDVFPASGYIGRTMTVELSGNGTTFDTSSTVSFGTGITVSNIKITGPDSMEATLAIAPTVTAGKVDVSVTSAGATISLPQAFELDAPVDVMAAADFQQGGLGSITITNKDLLNPFDTTQDQNTGEFTHVTVTSADPSVLLSVSNVTESEITLNAEIDVNATTTGAITVTSGSIMSPVAAVAVVARTAQVITPGTAADFTMAANGSLLSVTAGAAGLLNIELSTADTSGDAVRPAFALLPASGKWSDLIVVHQNFGDVNADFDVDNRVVAAGDKFYLVALELGGTPGYMATANAKTLSLAGVTAVTDTGENSTPAVAQALTGATAEFDGVLTDETDVDCFKVTTAANKKIHVYTTDDDGKTDSIVQIFANATQTTLANPINASTDADFGDDLETASLGAGTRAICVSASTFVTSLTNANYKAFVFIE